MENKVLRGASSISNNDSFGSKSSNGAVLLTKRVNLAEDIEKDRKLNKFKIKNKYVVWCLFVFALIFLSLIIARVPYVGSYVDAIFDFLFGTGKYFVYAGLMVLLFIKMFAPKTIKRTMNMKFYMICMVVFMGIEIIISTSHSIYQHFTDKSTEINFVAHWEEYINTWTSYLNVISYNDYFNMNFSGGLFGELIISTTIEVDIFLLFAFSLLLIVLGIFVMDRHIRRDTQVWYRFKSYIARKLGYKNDVFYDELANSQNEKALKSAKSNKNSSDSQSYSIPGIEQLPNSTLNYTPNQREWALKISEQIREIFFTYSIPATFDSVRVYPTFVEIYYNASTADAVYKVTELQQKIFDSTTLETLTIKSKNSLFWFEIKTDDISRVCMRDTLANQKTKNKLNFTTGVTYDWQPISRNVKEQGNILVVGKNKSGASSLMSAMISTACFLNDKKALQMSFISKTNNKSLNKLASMPQVSDYTCVNMIEVKDKLSSVKREIEERISYFSRKFDTSNFNEYISKTGNSDAVPTKVLVVNEYEELAMYDFEFSSLINYIAKRGPSAGVYLWLLSKELNPEAFDTRFLEAINNYYVLKLNSEAESHHLSIGNNGCLLYGKGDCIHVDKTHRSTLRFQATSISYNEIEQMLLIMKRA